MTKLLYWAATLPLCLMYLAAAGFYLTHGKVVSQGFVAFGFPAYLVQVLIVAKIAAPLAILSRLSVRLSDLAYAGMFYHLLLALSAHLNAGDGGYLPAILALALMLTSFLTQNAARKLPSSNVPWLHFSTRPVPGSAP
jgi:hypothetical protein